ncbi:hypothetical protein Hypma_014765 [Hypsizygus marmoreus]|uniref:Uncharacterized protein n=1 Tax=Hypsizygus marmoreus TaxID=39966 RepID=A0A369J9C8_HYPMA|nr:hypothetical protein Hypma_014765 [Hypsizygus marmoreus]
MISLASTLLLVSLLFSGVSAAPVGTRSLDVKTMRRMAETRDTTTTTLPVPRNIPDVVAKIHHDDATHVRRHHTNPPPKANDAHVRRMHPRHVRDAVPRKGTDNVARDTEAKEKRAPKPETEKTPTPRDPVDNVARADPDRAKKFAMRSEPAQKKKPVGKVVKRDPELVVRSTGDKIVKRDGGDDSIKVVVKRDPELVVKRAEPREEEKPRPKSLYSSGASPREVKEEEKKKRDDVRGPIGPIAMFRRTLEDLD